MKDFMVASFIVAVMGVFGFGGGVVLGDRIASKYTKEHFGFSVLQGREYKEQCESNLPRNVNCEVVVLYVPQNEQ